MALELNIVHSPIYEVSVPPLPANALNAAQGHLLLNDQGSQPVKVEDEVLRGSVYVLQDCVHAFDLRRAVQNDNSVG